MHTFMLIYYISIHTLFDTYQITEKYSNSDKLNTLKLTFQSDHKLV